MVSADGRRAFSPLHGTVHGTVVVNAGRITRQEMHSNCGCGAPAEQDTKAQESGFKCFAERSAEDEENED